MFLWCNINIFLHNSVYLTILVAASFCGRVKSSFSVCMCTENISLSNHINPPWRTVDTCTCTWRTPGERRGRSAKGVFKVVDGQVPVAEKMTVVHLPHVVYNSTSSLATVGSRPHSADGRFVNVRSPEMFGARGAARRYRRHLTWLRSWIYRIRINNCWLIDSNNNKNAMKLWKQRRSRIGVPTTLLPYFGLSLKLNMNSTVRNRPKRRLRSFWLLNVRNFWK